jgi:hypothetical protein
MLPYDDRCGQMPIKRCYQSHVCALRPRGGAYIGAARPALSERSCLELGLQVAALLDGFMIYTGPRSLHVTRTELSTMAKKAVLKLLDTPAA